MQLSSNGRKLIQEFEGFSLTAYPDAAGYSIGYGHYGAAKGQTITREEADKLFKNDVVKYEVSVSLTTPVATQDQFDAMTSLTYNIGTAGFAKSTVAVRHNMKDYTGAADAFLMWNKSQGEILPVLDVRRKKERNIYLNGYGNGPYSNPNPVSGNIPIASKSGVGQMIAGLVASGGFYLIYSQYIKTGILGSILKGQLRKLS
jgi:lysozyme